ncbi:hypothetical protein LCGC14_2183880 [marine sediment metagenome]|uniref:Uncharacterized protein n=1 Tax=marine sediment metagenome TaxID=412755 RepID=A0A0F9GH92_9ZZZZ
MTPLELRDAAYSATDESGRDRLTRLGFALKTQTIDNDGIVLYWFSAPVVYLGSGSHPFSRELQDAVLTRIAVDGELQAALVAVWMANQFPRYSAVTEYVRTSLPDLFEEKGPLGG